VYPKGNVIGFLRGCAKKPEINLALMNDLDIVAVRIEHPCRIIAMEGSTPLQQWRQAGRWPVCLDRIWGHWRVLSRAAKFQPYFESGFPYGHDQWISSVGTAWAANALALALESPDVSARR
jgi:hypothetical protein